MDKAKGKWINRGTKMTIDLGNAKRQLEELGYAHRTIERLECSNCRKLTLVDDSIKYNYCPHCGAKMEDKLNG